MNLNPTIEASSPLLIQVISVDCDITKNRYVTYYEIPTTQGCYRPIQNIQQITLISKIIKFKILDLQSPTSLPIYRNGQVKTKGQSNVQINLAAQQGSIKIIGKIINQADGTGYVFSLSIQDITGYNSFLAYRRKYKTLENVTRKQHFQLDHRLKVIDQGNSQFWFTMEESETTKYFFTNRKLTLCLEQIFKIQDWQTIETVQEQVMDLSDVEMCSNAIISVLAKMKITLNIQLIKNSNFAQSQMASIRILQISPNTQQLKIGTDKFRDVTSVKPLQQNRFYDYQYAYLNNNIKQLEGTSVYQHISKLTPSFPKYPHFINSKIIHIGDSKQLIFRTGDIVMKLPFVYILKGFNILQDEDYTIKFSIQFKSFSAEQIIQEQKTSDSRHFYEFALKDIWNLGRMAAKYSNFYIKIITESVIYYIPFTRTQVDKNNFKKQAKQLEMKEQYGEFNGNKYYMLTKSTNKDKILLTKTDAINDFYLIDLSTSNSIYFQIASNSEIKLQGILKRSKLVNSAGSSLEVVLSSSDNTEKVILFGTVNEVKEQSQSLRVYYKIMQRLQFTDDTPCDSIRYNLQIKRLLDNKKIKAKIEPEMQSDGISSLVTMQDGFYSPTSPELQLIVSVRKLFYDQQTQIFDNGEILNKKVIVNASPDKVLQKDCYFLNIQEEGFTSIEFDFYDQNIKKRLKLHIQFVLRRNGFFDATSGSYKIKIPPYLWKFNEFLEKSLEISIQTHLSHKKRRGGKASIFPDSPQQYTVPFYNHKDGISVKINDQIGYEKIMDAIKLKCQVVKNILGWVPQSQWYLAIINVGKFPFHFMIKYSYEASRGVESDAESVGSHGTVGKNKSERSYGEKIDPLAKTIKNMDLFNLKKTKNDVVNQSRKLTAQYIKCQETIIKLTKKIQQVSDQAKKKISEEKQILNFNNNSKLKDHHKNSKDMTKLTQFYRSICQCGASNPKFNGYCGQCLKKLKKRYEIHLKQYKEKSYTYEKNCFEKFNQKEKLIRIKNKLETYKEKLRTGQDLDEDNINNIVRDLEEQQLKRLIENQQIQIFRLKQRRKLFEETGKHRQEAIQNMIKKEDDQILEEVQELALLNNQIDDLRQKINKPA